MTTEIHVHGVIAAQARAPEPEGTRRIVHRELAAVVRDVESGGLRAAKVLREHWRVLEALAADATVLPVRFGTVMASDEAVVDEFLEPSHDALLAGLAELDGKVQLSVRASYEQETMLRGVVERSPAIARLRSEVESLPEAAGYAKRIQLGELVSAEVERERERDGALVLDRLAPLAVATRREPVSALEAAVNASFLVQRTGVDAFSRAVAELSRELEGRLALRYVGPLPAYSFVPEGADTWG
jgi:hypothetical protein